MPTTFRTVDGFYVDRDPVLVIDRSDSSSLESAIRQVLCTAQLVIPTPDLRGRSQIPVAAAAVKEMSWRTFARVVKAWEVESDIKAKHVCLWRLEADNKGAMDRRNVPESVWENQPIEDVASQISALLQSA